MFDADNKFTGEVFIKLCNENDKHLALSYSMSTMQSRYIEIFETNEIEY